MRYNHRYHAATRGTRQQRRRDLFALAILLVIVAILGIVMRTPLDHGQLIGGFVLSLYRVVAAYLVSASIALILGILTLSNTRLEGTLLPLLDVAQSFPSFSLLPILVYYFGQSSLSVIIILVVAMIWPILFNVISGIKEQRQDQAEAAVIFGARGWKFLAYYRWPMLRPSLITGSIISWGEAWDTIVGAEIIAGVMGAGHYLGLLGQTGQVRLLALGITVYLLIIFCINQLVWLPLLHRYTKYQFES